MPRVPLEPFVPWPESLRWRVHDAWFRANGTTPWESGDVPWRWTSCFPAARQVARFVVDHLAAHAPDGTVRVLELGCGNGAFVHGFFRALAEDRRAAAHAVRDRLIYHLADLTPTIPDAIARGFLSHEAARGRLVPGSFDVTGGGLRHVDGRANEARIDVVIANYVACATPNQVWRHEAGAWSEREAQLSVDDAEGRDVEALRALALAGAIPFADLALEVRWAPSTPRARCSPAVAEALEGLAARAGTVTLPVPFAFLDAMDALDPGLLLVSDFGSDDDDAIVGERACRPQTYGGSLAQAVDFVALDAWAAATGRACARTRDGRGVKVAALSRSEPRGFARHFRTSAASRFLDLAHGAKLVDQMGEPTRAITLYTMALELDPREPELVQQLGEALVRAGRPRDGLRVLRRGKRLDDRLDFDLSLGIALGALDRHADAASALRRSCARFGTPVAYTRLGNAYEALGRDADAVASYRRALDQKPDFSPARRFLAELEARTQGA